MKPSLFSQPSRFYTRNLNPMKIPMKKSVVNLFGAIAFVALSTISVQAATITWNTPVTISGDTDVATTGNPLYAYNGANSTASVNGVSFTGENSVSTWGNVGFSVSTSTIGGTTTAYGVASSPFNSLSSSYQTVLKGGIYANAASATITVTLNGLTSGKQYLVQIWVNDSRASTSRSETVNGGVSLNYNSTTAAGGVGQYTIGTFTASATTQTFTLLGVASSQLNAIQVRDTTSGYFSGASGTIWDASTTADWSTASGGSYNQTWSGVAGANAIFEGTANTVTVNGSVSDGSINFTTDGYTLAQGTSGLLTLTGGSITTGAGSDTIGVTLAGTLPVTKYGSGSLTLSGANTYTGATVVNGGTLQMNSFNSSSASVTVNNGGTLVLNFADALGYTASKNVPTIKSGGTITNIMSASRVTLWNGLTMTGGTLTGAATVSDGNGEYSLSGTVTATSDAGGIPATISGTPISLQNQNVANGSITFNVTRGSATPASDLNVSASLVPNSNAANIGIAKSGNGIMTLSATTNKFTGQLQVTGGTLNWNTAAALAPTSTYQPFNVQSGGTLVVNGYLKYSSGGSGNVYAYLNVGNNAAGGIGTITVNSGGSLSFTNMTSDPGSIIGQQGTGGISTLTVNGGAFNWDGSSSLAIGNGNGSGLLLITNNGAVTILAGASADDKYVALGRNSLTSTGTVYLASGTLASSCVFVCGGATPIGKAYFYFDGGTLEALANQTDWLQSTTVGNSNLLTAVTIKAGGATIDANGFNVAINNAIASGASPDGGLTLTNSTGTGILKLGGTCAYNGPTTVNGGILKVTGTVPTATTVNPGGAIGASSGTFSGLVTLTAGNSAVNLQDGSATTTTFANGLTLNNGNVLTFELGGSSDQISVGGTFTHNGTATINLAFISGYSASTYTLITDAANDINNTNGFVLGTVPSGFSAVLGTSGGALTVTITQNAPNTAYWIGGLGNSWNTVSGGNANWTTDAGGTVNTVVPPGTPTAVTFAATGAANFSTVLGANFVINDLTLSTANNVTIAGSTNSLTLAAGLVNASTALNNLISVSNLVLNSSQTFENDSVNPLTVGSLISGSAALTTAGNGTIVLASTNTYSGGTTISAGTLQLGDGSANNGMVAGAVNDNGELLFANPNAQSFSGAVSGSGVLGKTGTGLLDLPSANTYTGGTVISNGTLQIENNSALGTATELMTSSPVTITNNGILNLNIGSAATAAGRWCYYPFAGNGTINVIGTSNVESRLDGNMSGFTGTILVPASVATSKFDIEGDAVWNSAATIIVSNGGTLFVESATPTSDWAGQAEQVAATIYVSGSGNSEGYGALRVDDAAVLTGNVILLGNTVYGGAYDHHGMSGISGVISDGGLGYGISCANTISGQAEEFWGANTYSGATTWTNAAYTLVLGNGSALQNSTLNIGPGQLRFDSAVSSNEFVFGGLTGIGSFALTNTSDSPVTLDVGNNSSSSVYAGNLSDGGTGGGTLTKIGTGTLTLNGANSYGGLTTVAGGKLAISTLQTNATTGITVNDNAALTVNVSGTNQLAPATFTLGSSAGATNEYVGLASTTVAPVNAGTLAINGAIKVNILGGNFVVGNTYPMIQFGSISGAGGFALGSLPHGLVANIVTNGGNTIALYVSAYVPTLDVWTGAVNTNWDIATTTNWLIGAVASTYFDGDLVRFDDTAVSTNVFVPATVSPNGITVSNNVKTYTFSGSPIAGVGGLTKLGTGTLIVNQTNNYSGNTVISNGTMRLAGVNVIPGGSGKGDVAVNGTLDLNGHNELINGLSGSGTVDTVAGGTPTLTVGSSGSSTVFNGVIQNTAGTLSLTKNGNGTLVLSGTNAYTGATAVNQGSLNYSGSLGIAPATAAGLLTVNNSGNNAIVNVSAPANIQFNNNNPLIGNNAAGAGALYQSGGTLSGINQFQLGAVTGGSYGYYQLSGGTNTMAELDLGSFNGAAVGVLDMSGGTVNVTNWFVPSRGTAALGMLNMTGGTLTYSGPAGQFQGNWNGGVGTVVINLANASLLAPAANVSLMETGVAGKLGEINLLTGGLLQANSIAPGSATGNSVVNFNGGTLKANAATATFVTANNTAVNVYGNGGTIDNNGASITIPVPLLAPAGDGINDPVTVDNGGSGYIGAPAVTFAGDGVGAAGYAVMSGGSVASIVMTSPGYGYSYANVVLTGGGGSGASATAPAPTPNTSGGMTFTGAGTNILAAANTYTGNTTVSAGTLLVNGSTSTGAVTVNGGTLGGTGTVGGAVTVNSGGTLAPGAGFGTLTVNGNITFNTGTTSTFEVDGSTPANDAVAAGGAVAYGGVLNIVPTGTFTAGQNFTLFSGAGAASASNFSSIQGSPGSGLGFTFTNGVLSVVTAGPSGPAQLTNSYSGGTLALSWPAGQGWRLQMQTNSLSVGLNTNWIYITDGSISSTNIIVNPTKPTVFYRLIYP